MAEQTHIEKEKWYHQIWFVVLMLFVLGPFGFPLLWKSPKFSIQIKWTLTILVVAATIWAIWISFETFKVVYREVQELGRI